MEETNWTEEDQIAKIMIALEKMYQSTGILPVENNDTHTIYEFMEGKVPEKTIHLAIHHRIVFCADCDHVSGGNPEECESCYDQRYGSSKFRMW